MYDALSYVEHEVEKEKLSIRERMSIVLDKVGPMNLLRSTPFTVEEGYWCGSDIDSDFGINTPVMS